MIGSGLYLSSAHLPSVEGRLAVACAALGAAISHESAAELHSLQPVERGRLVVTVAVRRTHRFENLTVHQSTDLSEDHVVDVRGLTVTNPARTIYDLGAVASAKRLVRVVDHALSHDLTTLSELRGLLGQLARKGKPGTTKLRAVLDRIDPSYVPTESELESRLAAVIASLDVGQPVRQLALPWRTSARGRVDFAFPEHRLIIEADGRAWHAMSSAFDTDRMRDNLAQIAGWRVIRVTWRMLVERPQQVETLILRAIQGPAAA